MAERDLVPLTSYFDINASCTYTSKENSKEKKWKLFLTVSDASDLSILH